MRKHNSKLERNLSKLEFQIQSQNIEIFQLREQSSHSDLMKADKESMMASLHNYEKHCAMIDEQMTKEKQNQLEKESKISLLQERLEMVNDRDNELDRVFDYVWDLTRINIKYCPVEGDKVDKHLADIIN